MMPRGSGVAVVTGGCGFIGHHLVRRLVADGRHVRVVDDLSNGQAGHLPAEAEIQVGDAADPRFVREAIADAEVVFHLAAVASVQRANKWWFRSHVTNSGGAVAVMEAIRDLVPDAPFVYASSAAIYGDHGLPPGERLAESGRSRPLTPYGVDKRAIELHASAAGPLFGIRSCGLRFFNVYGSGQAADSPYSGVITRFVSQARSGQPLTIFGDGEQTRDFVHVDDVVGAILRAEDVAEAGAPVVNVCTGAPTRIRDLADLVAGLAGTRPSIVFGPPQPGDIRHSVGDPSLASRLLGWRASIELRSGMRQLLDETEAIANTPGTARAVSDVD